MKKDHTKSIIDTSLEQAKMWGNAEYMEDGLVLTEPSTVLTHASKRSIPATCYSSLNGTS